MEQLPQIFMRHPDITKLPPLSLGYGLSLHSHTANSPECDAAWEQLIEKGFGVHFSFEKIIFNWCGYKPEYLLYLAHDGKDIATTAAFENASFPNEGYIHMVSTLPEARGHGAGRTIVLAALHSLAARGFKTAVLSTDDERIPAIKLYLHLGFEPMYTHESHEERWQKIFSIIEK